MTARKTAAMRAAGIGSGSVLIGSWAGVRLTGNGLRETGAATTSGLNARTATAAGLIGGVAAGTELQIGATTVMGAGPQTTILHKAGTMLETALLKCSVPYVSGAHFKTREAE